jgi:hypothetical protein
MSSRTRREYVVEPREMDMIRRSTIHQNNRRFIGQARGWLLVADCSGRGLKGNEPTARLPGGRPVGALFLSFPYLIIYCALFLSFPYRSARLMLKDPIIGEII